MIHNTIYKSKVNEYFLRLDSSGNPTPGGPLRLLNNYFNPNCTNEGIYLFLAPLRTEVSIHYFAEWLLNY